MRGGKLVAHRRSERIRVQRTEGLTTTGAAGRGRGARERSHRIRALVAAGAVLAGAIGLGGCAAARDELGTSASDCYVDLAVAARAVHHEGRLQGVRLVSVASLRPHAPLLYDAAKTHGKRLGDVCLVAYGGDFEKARVESPLGQSTGRLAVVELGYPGRQLLATLLVVHPPLDFEHYHL